MPDFEDWDTTAVGDDVTEVLTAGENTTFGLPQPSDSSRCYTPELVTGVEECYRQQPRYGGTGESMHRHAQGMQAPYFVTTNQPLGSTSYGSHCSLHAQESQDFQRSAYQSHHVRASAAPSQSTVNEQPSASSDVNAQMISKQGYYDPTAHDPEERLTGKRYYSGWQY
jgi:hypothetical protein